MRATTCATSSGGSGACDTGQRIDRASMRAVGIRDGIAFAHPVLEAADEFTHVVAEVRERESTLGPCIAPRTPAVDDDFCVRSDLGGSPARDLAVVHVDGAWNAPL